jgi:predicted enzyme related to lactoylglutathione lyase
MSIRWDVGSVIGVRFQQEKNFEVVVEYLEIVTNDVDAVTALYQRIHVLSFGPSGPDLAHARVATRVDGTLVGIRKSLAAHEQPIIRTYLTVEDIQQAVNKADDSGATIAYRPTRQGTRGTLQSRFMGTWNTDYGTASLRLGGFRQHLRTTQRPGVADVGA